MKLRLLSALLVLGFSGWVLAAHADKHDAKDAKDAKTAHVKPVFEEMDFDKLPEAVQKTVEKEKGKGKPDEVYKVTRGERVYYKVYIDQPGDDKMLVINPKGELMASWDLTGEGPRKEVKFDDLPKAVQTELKDEYGEKNIKKIYEMQRTGRKLYQVHVKQHGAILVDEHGRHMRLEQHLVEMEGTTREVKWDTMPGTPKGAIGKEIGGNKVDRVFQVTKGDKTHWLVQSVDGKLFTVDADGKITHLDNKDAKDSKDKEKK